MNDTNDANDDSDDDSKPYILDINNKSSYSSLSFTTDPQLNIKILVDTYGEHIIIKNENVYLPTNIYTVFNNTYYGIKYDMEERSIPLLPFDVIFGDYCTYEKNDTCHINSIHRYGELSGTDIVETLQSL